MHATIALLPLLAFVTTIIAAPTPLSPIVRSVPDIKAVIRNPAPVDNRQGLELDVDLNIPIDLDLDLGILGRAAPAVNSIISEPFDVVNRAVPALKDVPVDPVDIVGRAAPAVGKTIKDPVDIVN